jgi:hypothetical protein
MALLAAVRPSLPLTSLAQSAHPLAPSREDDAMDSDHIDDSSSSDADDVMPGVETSTGARAPPSAMAMASTSNSNGATAGGLLGAASNTLSSMFGGSKGTASRTAGGGKRPSQHTKQRSRGDRAAVAGSSTAGGLSATGYTGTSYGSGPSDKIIDTDFPRGPFDRNPV